MPSPAAKSIKPKNANWFPPWAPRFWHGMRVSSYWKLLRENRFQVHPARWPMAGLISGCTVANSTLSAAQTLLYRKRVEAMTLDRPLVFIIGHWRSGTTLMHELISRDPRFSFPSNFDAFVPEHFLVSRAVVYPLIKLLMPSRRPMDNMTMGAASPQEDDFALCAYGAPTPYRRIAFPNRPNRDHLQLNFDQADAATQAAVRQSMTQFLKALTFRYRSGLVLKSPPHTGRIKQLAEWFPNAKFIHMARDPQKLVVSTMRLWRLLDEINGFQLPKYDDTWLKNYVFECKDLMYDSYLQHRDSLPKDRLIEVRFEDLVASPVATVSKAYEQLKLPCFENVQPQVESYFEQKRGHKKNEFTIDETLQQEIHSNWRRYRQAFGYTK